MQVTNSVENDQIECPPVPNSSPYMWHDYNRHVTNARGLCLTLLPLPPCFVAINTYSKSMHVDSIHFHYMVFVLATPTKRYNHWSVSCLNRSLHLHKCACRVSYRYVTTSHFLFCTQLSWKHPNRQTSLLTTTQKSASSAELMASLCLPLPG